MRIEISRTHLFAAAAAIVLSVLTGCETTHSPGNASSTARAALPGTPACLMRGNFQGSWTVLNNTSLILYAFPRNRESYLVRLFQPVVGLKFNVRLGFEDVQRTGRICGNGNSFLIAPGNTPERIMITDVRRLTDPERDQLLAEAGHPSPTRSASSSNETPQ